jgi:hypothetical protein
MSTIHYHLDEDFVASDIVRWYQKEPVGATAVITLRGYPCVRMYHRANEQVYWCTEGNRGLTISLDDAQQRLAMFQGRWRVGM